PALVLRLQSLGHPGLERARASPRLESGQPLAQVADPGQLAPTFAVPADDTLRLAPVLEADQRRRKLDVIDPGVIELAVIDDAGDPGRKFRVILGHHLECRNRLGDLLHYRLDQ